MTRAISLRNVDQGDLADFFEQQLDPDAIRMASFPPRHYDEFMSHWMKIIDDGNTVVRTIVVDEQVAGHIVGWQDSDEPKVGYWLSKKFWGQGVASAALSQFLLLFTVRPLYARVAKGNVASIRVLRKCGFTLQDEDTFALRHGGVGEEFVFVLGGARAGDNALARASG
jgi:RimJ/RimL family protein N-acetyltransferase